MNLVIRTIVLFLMGATLLAAARDEDGPKINIGFMFTSPRFANTRTSNSAIRAGKAPCFRPASPCNSLVKLLDYEKIDDWRGGPNEMLTKLCSSVTTAHINALVYISSFNEHTSAATAPYITHLANFLGLPVFMWLGKGDHVQTHKDSMVLHMTPSINHECRAIFQLLKRYNWEKFSLVVASQNGKDNFVNAMKMQLNHIKGDFTILSTINFDSETKIHKDMPKYKNTESRVFILYASRETAKVVFEEARAVGLTGKDYVWIVTMSAVGSLATDSNPELLAPDEYPLGLFGVSHDFIHKNEPERDTFEEQDMMRESLEETVKIWINALITFQDALMKQNRINEMIPALDCSNDTLLHWDVGKQFFDILLNTSLDNDGPFFEPDGSPKHTSLRIVNARQDPEAPWRKKWKMIGRWSTKDGLRIDDITWPGDSATPPKGRPAKYHLKIVTLKEPPYVIYSDIDPDTMQCPQKAKICKVATENKTLSSSGTNSSASDNYMCCSGLCIDLLETLAERMSFTYELEEVADKLWGILDRETKEWDGLVRAIMDEKYDLVMTSLKITPERSTAIDFSIPFLETGITIIVAVREGVISPTAFLEPYDYPSWCLILVFSIHASGAAIFVFEWLSPSGLDRGNKPLREHRFSLFRAFWLIWAMLFGAAVNVDNPRGVSSRFLANVWALFAVVFTAKYTANLAAFMITEEDYDKIIGIRDPRLQYPMRQKPPFKFGTIPRGSTESNLRTFHPHMYEYMKNGDHNTNDVESGIKKLKEGDINAFIYDATVLEYLAGKDEHCRLRTVGTWYAMTGYGIGFPKRSQWLEIFNQQLLLLQDDGELERLRHFWLSGACQEKEIGEASLPLGILNFTSAFILLAGGMLLGGFLMLMEHVYFKFFRSRLRKWDRCGCCGLVSLSMGKSLTFEQSVHEAIELQKHHKCKNPICETNVWKLKHELDLALLRIDRLQRSISEKQIDFKCQPPDRSYGWKANILPVQPNNISSAWVGEPTNSSPAVAALPPIPWDPVWDQQTENTKRNKKQNKGSKSLPNSPMKRPHSDYAISSGAVDRSTSSNRNSFYDNLATCDKGDKKTKVNQGKLYVEVPPAEHKVEKETVL